MEVLPMNRNDNRFTEALALTLHKMVEREHSGAVDCYGLALSVQAGGETVGEGTGTKK